MERGDATGDIEGTSGGSAGCLAGWAFLLQPGARLLPYGDRNPWKVTTPDGGRRGWSNPMQWFCMEQGMDQDDASALFGGNRTLEELKIGVAAVLADYSVSVALNVDKWGLADVAAVDQP